MKIQLFILGCCILQSIYGFNNADELSKLVESNRSNRLKTID